MSKIYGHMKKSERAKQFLAFSALKGLEEELAEVEFEPCRQCELLEDEAEELNRKLCLLQCGNEVKVRHYKDGRYVTTIGKLIKIDHVYNTLKINDMVIKTANIISIDIIC